MPNPLNVLFLASEADPFIKVGGLGDVAGSLPHALRRIAGDASVDVRLVIPFHNAIRTEALDLQRETAFTIRRGGDELPAQVYRTDMNGLSVYLISGDPINSTNTIYTSDTYLDGAKYTFFSLAALELARRIGFRPHIVHANDWHTAPAIYSVRNRRVHDDIYENTRTILGIHNLAFMGAGSSAALYEFEMLPVTDRYLPDWARHVPLPMGLWAADALVAVSPTYAQEIMTPEFGCGLEGFLQTRRGSIHGIVNGIDMDVWNPATDEALTANYDASRLAERTANKAALQTRFGFTPDPDVPLLAMITRMDPQKGVDIALDALRMVTDIPWQVIILGTGVNYLEDAARRLEAEFPERVCAAIRFDSKLSRQIYGGADVLLMPSRYEPCGLAQMIAMRYGCIPLVRATGGLRDTVHDGETGFVFQDPTPREMAEALRRALPVFSEENRWHALQRNGMSQDFSWDKSAREYLALYQSLTSKPETEDWGPN
jgi:starch synthase